MSKIATMVVAAASTITLAAGPALAGDWDGFSLGIGGGYGIANNQFTVAPGPALGGILAGSALNIDGFGGKGGFFTLGLGYDHKLSNKVLIGAFVDYDFDDIDNTTSLSIPPLANLNVSTKFKIENQLSIGGRLGYLVSPSTLFFATGGYARVDTSDVTASLTGPIALSGTLASVGTFNGYFVGGGVETMVWDGFSVKAEYRYTSMDSENATLLPGTGLSNFISTSIKPQIQTARVSLNYHFGDTHSDKIDDPAPPATSRSWTGPYIGFGGGYGAASNDFTLANKVPAPGSIFTADVDGFGHQGGFVSGTLGYDYQLAPKIVVGAFADDDLTDLQENNGLILSLGGAGLGIGTKTTINDILMVGGRLGYLTSPDTLLFVSGGYANAGIEDTDLKVSLGGASASINLIGGGRFSGGFIGGGFETRLNDWLSLKAEYRYIDLGSEDVSLLPGVLPGINTVVSTTFDPVVQTGQLSINYRFGGPAEPPSPLK